MARKVVVVDGARTPFLRSGTGYKELMSYQLGQIAIKALLDKTQLDANTVDQVIMGTVSANVKTSNVARESALLAGIPISTPCSTVTMACISANKSISMGVDQIALGHADVVIAGGTECPSDAPIAFPREMRKKLFANQKMRGMGDYVKFASSLRPSDFVPEAPAIAEFTTGRTMGQDCDRMVDRFGITREAQDHFAVRSHSMAIEAQEKGFLAQEVVPAELPPKFKLIEQDNGPRADTKFEKISKLKPAFNKPDGTLTAANSSFLTDGAAVTLLMSEEKALELGYTPKAEVLSYVFTAQNPDDELLLGPAFATPAVLKKAGMSLDQMDVLEIHEAFAGQVLCNIKCLEDAEFGKARGFEGAVGKVDMDKLNRWGGSLSIGHPFGATGSRLVNMASNRLHVENGTYALIAACAAGAHGHAMILKRYGA